MIRPGLCCLFSETPIKYRSVTVKSLLAEATSDVSGRLERVSELVVHNVSALQQSIVFCAQNHIGCFRINSQLWPCYTHPGVGYRLEQLPDREEIEAGLAECRRLADKYDVRLSFHPDQFVVLNSPRDEVVVSSVQELEYHALIAQMVGADVINIHVGGVYGDKATAMEAFVKNFPRLSEEVRTRLTLENDDKSYGPDDILHLCDRLKIPFVYDVHHHRCSHGQLTDETIEDTSRKAAATWLGREPLFHISSPLTGWNSANPRIHDQMISYADFPAFWKRWDTNFTLEVEAKAKEVAVAKLAADLRRDQIPLWKCTAKLEAVWQPVVVMKKAKKINNRKITDKADRKTDSKKSVSSSEKNVKAHVPSRSPRKRKLVKPAPSLVKKPAKEGGQRIENNDSKTDSKKSGSNSERNPAAHALISLSLSGRKKLLKAAPSLVNKRAKERSHRMTLRTRKQICI